MQGRHRPQKALFQAVDLDDLIPENHLLRRIDAAVDLSFIHQRVAHLYKPGVGRPSVDPEVVLRMMLLGYLFNLSDVKLVEEVTMHAGYRWFCRLNFQDRVPDRTTLVKLRRERWGRDGVFDDLMREVVRQCVAAGLVQGEELVVDGTQVKANAATKSLARIQPPVSLTEYLAQFDEPGPCGEGPSDRTPPPPPSPSRRGGETDFRGERFRNETHRSTTDPDARLYRKAKGQEAALRYLVHDLIDAKSRVIVATTATQATGRAEREAALYLVDEALPRLPGTTQRRCLAADKGYDDGAFLADLLDRHIDPVIPPRHPGPMTVPVYRRRTRDLARYRARTQRIRVARARIHVHAISRRRRQRLRLARTQIEHCFAEAKQWHGLYRARSRGLWAMRVQALLTATAQNLKRLAACRGRKRGAGVQQAPKDLGIFQPKLAIVPLAPVFS